MKNNYGASLWERIIVQVYRFKMNPKDRIVHYDRWRKSTHRVRESWFPERIFGPWSDLPRGDKLPDILLVNARGNKKRRWILDAKYSFSTGVDRDRGFQMFSYAHLARNPLSEENDERFAQELALICLESHGRIQVSKRFSIQGDWWNPKDKPNLFVFQLRFPDPQDVSSGCKWNDYLTSVSMQLRGSFEEAYSKID